MKAIITFLLLLITVNVSSQIKFNSSLETGYEDRYLSIYQPDSPTAIAHFKHCMFSTLEISTQYKQFSIYTDIKTYIHPLTVIEYQPIQSQYRIGASYQLNRFEFRYEHLCSHSIEQPFFHEGYDRVSCKIMLVNNGITTRGK